MPQEKANFGAGCFWSLRASFAEVWGVMHARAGYAGGYLAFPTHEDVVKGRGGHAEVVEVVFDPEVVTYHSLLEVFFSAHNPTQPYLRSGSKDRSHYRSIIQTHTPAQSRQVTTFVEAINASGRYAVPVSTEVEAATQFWPAGEIHQQSRHK